MLELRLVAIGMVLSAVFFGVFGLLSHRERSAQGRQEGRVSVGLLFRLVPRFGPREHYTSRGWRYRQIFMVSWFIFVALGLLLVFQLPDYMN